MPGQRGFLSALILLLCCCCTIFSQEPRVSRTDLLAAMPSEASRFRLVEASRRWRRGVRTVVVSDGLLPPKLQAKTVLYREAWRQFRDIKKSNLTVGPQPGDLRAAMAPFIAAKAAGPENFKWMMFGDDDTVFFVDNVLQLVENLDHELPYVLTDALWFPEGGNGTKAHPNRDAPRCLPCGFVDELLDKKGCPGHRGYIAAKGCPCTHERICDGSWPGGLLQEDGRGPIDRQACDFVNRPGHWDNPYPGWWYMLHGGAGTIISSGFFKQKSFEEVESYINKLAPQSGDAVFFRTLWYLFKLGPTDPGYGFCRSHIQMFDPGYNGPKARGPEDEGTADYGGDPVGVLTRFEAALSGNKAVCDPELCEDQLRHTISVHVRSRYAALDLELQDKNPVPYSVAAHLITKLAVAGEQYAALQRNSSSFIPLWESH